MESVPTGVAQSVDRIADPAFVTDERQRIVAWNRAAEQLLGYAAMQVRGKACHEIFCGTDLFGNRICDRDCVIGRMATRGEPIASFEMSVRKADGTRVSVAISVVPFVEREPAARWQLHVFRPVHRAGEAQELLQQLLGWSAACPPQPTAAPEAIPLAPPLTPRELDVLRHLFEGKPTAEIARALFVSVSTVRSHVRNILVKLEAHSRLEAVATARKKGLI